MIKRFNTTGVCIDKRHYIVNIDNPLINIGILYGYFKNENGVKELCDYLDVHGLDNGYLISLSFNKEKEYKEETVELNGKEIFSVMV